MTAISRRKSGPPAQVARQGLPKKPGCPMHHVEMVFDPSTAAWGCTESGCSFVAYPRADHDAGKGKPTMGEGILEIVVHGSPPTGRVYLRAPDNNVMLDVTDYLRRVDDQMPKHYDLTLRLTNITNIGE